MLAWGTLKLFLIRKDAFYSIIKIVKILIFYFLDCNTLDDNETESHARGIVSNTN